MLYRAAGKATDLFEKFHFISSLKPSTDLSEEGFLSIPVDSTSDDFLKIHARFSAMSCSQKKYNENTMTGAGAQDNIKAAHNMNRCRTWFANIGYGRNFA